MCLVHNSDEFRKLMRSRREYFIFYKVLFKDSFGLHAIYQYYKYNAGYNYPEDSVAFTHKEMRKYNRSYHSTNIYNGLHLKKTKELANELRDNRQKINLYHNYVVVACKVYKKDIIGVSADEVVVTRLFISKKDYHGKN